MYIPKLYASIAVLLALSPLATVGLAQEPERYVNGSRSIPETEESKARSKAEAEANRKIDKLMAAGDYAGVESLARKELSGPLASVSIETAYGEALLRQHKNFDALQVFRRLNGIQSDKESYCRVGLLLLRLGRFEASRDMYTSDILRVFCDKDFIDQSPTFHDAKTLEGLWLFTIVQIAERHGINEEIDYYYSQAIKFNPRNPMLNYTLGKKYLREGKYAQAMACYRIVIDKSKGRFVEFAWKDYEQAEALLKEQEDKE